MSKIILVANQCKKIIEDKGAQYIGVDGGALTCLKQNVSMICAIGDFDSIQENELNLIKKNTKTIILPKEKDMVDSEYALRYASQLGADEIEIQGVIGGRLDHFITIYNLLQMEAMTFSIKDEQNLIYSLDSGSYNIEKKSKYISIFACEDLKISFDGVKYPLKEVCINEKDIYLVSNEIVEDIATLIITGKVIVMECDDKK